MNPITAVHVHGQRVVATRGPTDSVYGVDWSTMKPGACNHLASDLILGQDSKGVWLCVGEPTTRKLVDVDMQGMSTDGCLWSAA